jgi:hypothetical protein
LLGADVQTVSKDTDERIFQMSKEEFLTLLNDCEEWANQMARYMPNHPFLIQERTNELESYT